MFLVIPRKSLKSHTSLFSIPTAPTNLSSWPSKNRVASKLRAETPNINAA
jgi:hypothetical protein